MRDGRCRRPTLTIDDDVLAAAKQFADARGLTLGEAVSHAVDAFVAARRQGQDLFG